MFLSVDQFFAAHFRFVFSEGIVFSVSEGIHHVAPPQRSVKSAPENGAEED
jgi:hypothetical protein